MDFAREALLKALEVYFLTQMRDWKDDHIPVWANNKFMIPCSNCKKISCWESYPEEIVQDMQKPGDQITF